MRPNLRVGRGEEVAVIVPLLVNRIQGFVHLVEHAFPIPASVAHWPRGTKRVHFLREWDHWEQKAGWGIKLG